MRNILAVVVSYNGGIDIRDTVNAILNVVDLVYIVDNASNPYNKNILECLNKYEKVEVEFLSENVGIGAALNLGVKKARENNFDWILTMDQDSVFKVGFLKSFDSCKNEYQDVCVMTPNVNNSSKQSNCYKVDYAITSGNLIKVNVFKNVGLYNEILFIDGVDFDFSFRLVNSGYEIFNVPEAHLDHCLGDVEPKYFKRFHTYHSPLRRYYIFRNHFYLIRNFWRTHSFILIKMSISRVVYIFTITIFGHLRLKSYKYIFKGIFDSFKNKKGAFRDK